ncbi:MAG: cell division ATP-binding protein FtsE, partial [Actinomycetota bacterium]
RMQKRVVEIRSGQIVRDAQTASYREIPSDSIPVIPDSPADIDFGGQA